MDSPFILFSLTPVLYSLHGTVLLGGVGDANCFITSPLFEPGSRLELWSRLELISDTDSRGFGGI